jgi:hypothetical protein
MLSIARAALAATCFFASVNLALAGASSVPTNYQPDPALQRATRGELEARVRKACAVIQARELGVSESSLSRPCGCYASRTLTSFTPGELQSYRDTGVFNQSAQAKAYAALSACGVRRG